MSKDLEKRVAAIEARNKKVELDKAWEISLTRRILILVLTYLVIVIFMIVADIGRPFVNAIVPAVGFSLSTLTVSFIKTWWISRP
jgi:hypothetical protein